MPSALPPRDLLGGAVRLAMVHPAQRHGEFVADLAAECARRGKPQMMRIGRLPAADQAGLPAHELQMLLVAMEHGFGDGEPALGEVAGVCGRGLRRAAIGSDAMAVGGVDVRYWLQRRKIRRHSGGLALKGASTARASSR